MQRLNKLWILIAGTAFALNAHISLAASAPATASGSFSAKLEVKALRNEKSGRTPQLTFTGKFQRSGAKARLEVVNELTAESQVYLVDGDAHKAWLLFPDTLNGMSAEVVQGHEDDRLRQAQAFISGDFSKVPANWGKPQAKQETLDGKAVTKLTYTLPKSKGATKSGTVQLWHSADKAPVRLIVDSFSAKLTVTFADYAKGVKLDSGSFTPDKKYKIKALGKGEKLPLPGGLPSDLQDG